jgi:hypothetical protein
MLLISEIESILSEIINLDQKLVKNIIEIYPESKVEYEIRFIQNYIKEKEFLLFYNSLNEEEKIYQISLYKEFPLSSSTLRINNEQIENKFSLCEKYFFNSIQANFNVNLEYSTDSTMNLDIFNKLDSRHIKRKTIKKEHHDIMYSIVNDEQYEIEIEISPYYCTVGELIESIKYITKNLMYKHQEFLQTLIKQIIVPPKPIIFKHEDIFYDSYYYTPKYDGVYYKLIIYHDKIYRVNNGSCYYVSNYINTNINIYFLDTEFMNDIYYIFDIQLEIPFCDRLNEINKIKTTQNLQIKPYIKKPTSQTLQELQESKNIDGFICVKEQALYKENPKKWKFKPTVDFKVMDNFLYVYDNNKSLVKFKGYTHDCTLNNIIAEFFIQNKKFIFHRVRRDKNLPNHISVVKDTIKSNIELLTHDMLLFKNNKLFRWYTRNFKYKIIDSLSGNILNIGSGTGSDFFRFYLNKKIKEVVCIEKNQEYIKEAQKKIQRKSKIRISIITGDHQPRIKFDHIVIFFVINQISDLDTFILSIKKYIEHMTKLHILFFDSDQFNFDNDPKYEHIVKAIKIKENQILFNIDSSTAKNIIEYLYNEEFLLNKFKQHNIKISKHKHENLKTSNFVPDHINNYWKAYKYLYIEFE